MAHWPERGLPAKGPRQWVKWPKSSWSAILSRYRRSSYGVAKYADVLPGISFGLRSPRFLCSSAFMRSDVSLTPPHRRRPCDRALWRAWRDLGALRRAWHKAKGPQRGYGLYASNDGCGGWMQTEPSTGAVVDFIKKSSLRVPKVQQTFYLFSCGSAAARTQSYRLHNIINYEPFASTPSAINCTYTSRHTPSAISILFPNLASPKLSSTSGAFRLSHR